MQYQPHSGLLAFGETFGLDVPTRYPAETHDLFNTLLAADSMILPALLGLSPWTRWLYRALAALLVAGRRPHTPVERRQQLQVEATAGLALMGAALFGRLRAIARISVFVSGLLILANSLMTQVED